MSGVVVDLDGTLCDHTHRIHHLSRGQIDWEAYNSECSKDVINPAIAVLIDYYKSKDHQIVLVTGRTERHRPATETWLLEHKVPYNFLYMRGNHDFRPNEAFKRDVYFKNLYGAMEIILAVDDSTRVAQMWTALKIPCLVYYGG